MFSHSTPHLLHSVPLPWGPSRHREVGLVPGAKRPHLLHCLVGLAVDTLAKLPVLTAAFFFASSGGAGPLPDFGLARPLATAAFFACGAGAAGASGALRFGGGCVPGVPYLEGLRACLYFINMVSWTNCAVMLSGCLMSHSPSGSPGVPSALRTQMCFFHAPYEVSPTLARNSAGLSTRP